MTGAAETRRRCRWNSYKVMGPLPFVARNAMAVSVFSNCQLFARKTQLQLWWCVAGGSRTRRNLL
ncbi:hypothetical protein TSUD_282780 [Trifolium subterraneum]|uniref:Uncharacterized protein n=1 Tax=Trifolium subterraneum TaxID=3900 RepID=A0A2Z6PRX0_TRISU|nr:hypothetical protein TSUD_282780 [Trifolium subterraneum]